jgi:hypothetical protein
MNNIYKRTKLNYTFTIWYTSILRFKIEYKRGVFFFLWKCEIKPLTLKKENINWDQKCGNNSGQKKSQGQLIFCRSRCRPKCVCLKHNIKMDFGRIGCENMCRIQLTQVTVQWKVFGLRKVKQKNSMALVRKRTIPTERPPLPGEVSTNFSGLRVSRGQRNVRSGNVNMCIVERVKLVMPATAERRRKKKKILEYFNIRYQNYESIIRLKLIY